MQCLSSGSQPSQLRDPIADFLHLAVPLPTHLLMSAQDLEHPRPRANPQQVIVDLAAGHEPVRLRDLEQTGIS